ncbi:MAG: hypothetical protein LBT30_07225 [Clostridiales bacterium]|jgi:hypothetical protein|nr:hypothetical protein [Clostridiales bacterium]
MGEEILIADIQRVFTPSDEKRHIGFEFEVKRQYKYLKINYAYSPKDFTDDARSAELLFDCAQKSLVDVGGIHFKNALPFKNLLTLSVDSPSMTLGCAHRHDNDIEIMIGAASSCGFLPARIETGVWTAVVSTHCVLSVVTARITVRGGI